MGILNIRALVLAAILYFGFNSLLAVASAASTAEIPVTSVQVWETQQNLMRFEDDQFESFETAQISDEKRKLLILSCRAEVRERARNQTSQFFNTQKPCVGVVGETACLRELERSAIDGCIASRLLGQ